MWYIHIWEKKIEFVKLIPGNLGEHNSEVMPWLNISLLTDTTVLECELTQCYHRALHTKLLCMA